MKSCLSWCTLADCGRVRLVLLVALLMTASPAQSGGTGPGSSANNLNCNSFVSSSSYTATNEPYQSRLHACFQSNTYDTSQVPLQTTSGTPYLQLNYSFAVVNFLSFDNGVVQLFYQLKLDWYDFHRQWDTNVVPVNFIEVPLSELWYPRIQMLSADQKRFVELVDKSALTAQIYYNSAITLFVNNIFQASCTVDLSYFPFDTQYCVLTFRLDREFFNGVDVVIVRESTAYKFAGLANDEWYYINDSTTAANFSNTLATVLPNGTVYSGNATTLSNIATGFNVTIVLQRKIVYYLVNLVCPVVFLTLLGLVTYFIEDNSELKIKTPFAIMLAYLFIQTYITTLIPPSRITPYIALYVLACLALTTASNCGAGLCYYLATKPGQPPERVYYLLVELMGFPFYPSRWTACCRARKRSARVAPSAGGANGQQSTSEGEVSEGHVDEENESKWEEVAAALNRLFAIIYVVAAIVFFGVFLIPIFIAYSYYTTN